MDSDPKKREIDMQTYKQTDVKNVFLGTWWMNNIISLRAGYFNPKWNDSQAVCSYNWDGLLMQ